MVGISLNALDYYIEVQARNMMVICSVLAPSADTLVVYNTLGLKFRHEDDILVM